MDLSRFAWLSVGAALIALRVAAKPADANHHDGHGKAEYFSAGAEGVMIFIAAAIIPGGRSCCS